MIGRTFKTGVFPSIKVQVIAKRSIKKGDYFISGAVPAAYYANHDLDRVGYVAVPVEHANNFNRKIEREITLELSSFITQLASFDPSINKAHVLNALDTLRKEVGNL